MRSEIDSRQAVDGDEQRVKETFVTFENDIVYQEEEISEEVKVAKLELSARQILKQAYGVIPVNGK